MTFINDQNEVLETTTKLAVTKQAVSFFGFKIKGDYSVNFDVPNNSVTRDVLNYEGPQMVNQVAFTRQSFTLMRDGNPFMRGGIVIQDDEMDKLDCYFVSGNSNWINLLQGIITDLDFTSYRKQWVYSSVSSTATSGIIFPLVDWVYGLNKGNNKWFISKIFDKDQTFVGEIQDVGNFVSEFYPCFYVSSLVNEIFQQNGLKYSGTLFSDPIYQRMIVTPYQQIKRDSVPKVSANGTLYTSAASSTYEKYNTFVESYDPENLFSSSRYTSTRYGLLKVTVTCTTNAGDHMLNYQFRKNNVSQNDYLTLSGGDPAIVVGTIISYEIPVTPGDYIEIWVFSDVAAPPLNSVTLNIDIETNTIIGPKDYVTPNDFLYPYKSMDIIKFLVSFFGCVTYFDEYSKTVSINIIEKIKKETALNFSDYYLSHRAEYTVDQAKNNYVKLADADDAMIKTYNANNQTPFGGGNVTTSNRLKDSNDLFKIPFGASVHGLSKNLDWLTSIGLITLTDGDPLPYTAIANSGGLASMTMVTNLSSSRQIARIQSDSGQVISGYFICNTPNTFYGLNYSSDGTGNIYLQTINFNTIQPRLLITSPSTSVADIATDTSLDIYESGSANTVSAVQYPFFAKKVTGDGIDNLKVSASWGEINDALYNDPVISEVYFRQITKILNNPTIRMQMLIPEAVFQSVDFSRFIYVKAEKIDGYFFIDSIVNYQNGSTPVEVNLYML